MGSLGFLESSNSVLTQLQEALKAVGLRIRRISQSPGAILVGAVVFFGRARLCGEAGGLLRPRPNQQGTGCQRKRRLWHGHRPGRICRKFSPPPPATWWPSPNPRSDRPAASPTGLGMVSAPGWEWCAIFVSWCAEQCGYIDAGIVPKFAGCGVGVQWFQKTGDSGFQAAPPPSQGWLIFFQWYGSDSSIADHVGHRGTGGKWPCLHHRGQRGRPSTAKTATPYGYGEIKGYGVPVTD